VKYAVIKKEDLNIWLKYLQRKARLYAPKKKEGHFIFRPVKDISEITLKYNDKIPAISGLKRISKPGQRIYLSSKKIKKVQDGYGIAIISTSKGLKTDSEAKKQKLGGEVICEVW